MKIAYLVNQYPAVSHTFVRREIRALEELGLHVERVSVRRVKGEPLADPADREEAAITRVILDGGVVGLARGVIAAAIRRPSNLVRAARTAASLGTRSERGLLYHAAYLAEACVLVDWLERSKVEHLHAHFGTNSAAVAMLCEDLGGPGFSFTAHGPEEFDKPEAIKLGAKIERAKFVAAISSFGRSQLWRRARSKHWDKVHVVRCGLDAAFLDREPEPVPDVPRLVCIGRLNEQKGQLLLLEAIARVAKKRRVELVLVGDGELRGELEAAIAKHRLENVVRITGWASGDAVRAELAAARAMVLPSFAEGLPVVIMESLALGRPVIGTMVAGIPELLEHGTCGWLVPAGSVDALEGAIHACLDTPIDALNRMAVEGRRRVRAMHDVRTSARELARLFRRATGRPDEQLTPERPRHLEIVSAR